MSHYQSKGDRSEAQLKKAGRSSGPGHQRSGAPSTAVKGGGAGGPSPSGSAPPATGASLTTSQSFSAAATSGRPTTPGSSTHRGGKRANGPAGIGRASQSGVATEHGGNFRNPQYSAQYQNQQSQQQQQQAPVGRQGLGPADSNQHPPTNSGQQSELKQSAPSQSNPVAGSKASGSGGVPGPAYKQPSVPVVIGAASKPPAPVVPSATLTMPEPASPVTTASSAVSRSPVQPSFSFQFGSISPSFMNIGPGMQIPARTSSAPPNLDEQKREQARFEASRTVLTKKVPSVPSGQPQGQVSRVAANASEQPQTVLQLNQNGSSQSPVPGGGSQQQPATQAQALTQPPVQFTQGQVHPLPHGHGPQQPHAPIHPQVQVSPQHLQHMQLAAAHQAQVQAQQVQAHAQQQQQQQVLAQQALPQQSLPQQGLVQQSLSQGMKYPQSMMAPHGAQIISQQMGNPLANQLSAQQVPPQMAHQLGPQMGGAIGGQLPPGMSGAQYGPPATNQYIQPQRSRAVKIVNPDTLEELRFEAKAKKGEPFMDAGPPTSVSTSSGLPARISSNGPPPQPRAVNYGSATHHAMVPPSMNYYQQIQSGPYSHTGPFYQSGQSKSLQSPGGPPVNTPPVRYSYPAQTPAQGISYMSHPGAASNPPPSKVGTSGGLGAGLTGSDMINVSSSGPFVGGPGHPVIQTISPIVSGRSGASLPSSQTGGVHAPSSNRRGSTSVPVSTSTISAVPAISPTNSGVAFKFGDVEASGTPASGSAGESPSHTVSGAQSQVPVANGLKPLSADLEVPKLSEAVTLELEESGDSALANPVRSNPDLDNVVLKGGSGNVSSQSSEAPPGSEFRVSDGEKSDSGHIREAGSNLVAPQKLSVGEPEVGTAEKVLNSQLKEDAGSVDSVSKVVSECETQRIGSTEDSSVRECIEGVKEVRASVSTEGEVLSTSVVEVKQPGSKKKKKKEIQGKADATASGLPAKISSNGPPQPKAVNHGGLTQNTAVGVHMNPSQQLQSGPSSPYTGKSSPSQGGPSVNTVPVRHNSGPQNPMEAVAPMSEAGDLSNVTKVGPSAERVGSSPCVSDVAGADGLSTSPAVPLPVGPSSVELRPTAEPSSSSTTGRQAATPDPSLVKADHIPAYNGNAPGLAPPSSAIIPSNPVTAPAATASEVKVEDVDPGITADASSRESIADAVPTAEAQASTKNEAMSSSVDQEVPMLMKAVAIEEEESVAVKNSCSDPVQAAAAVSDSELIPGGNDGQGHCLEVPLNTELKVNHNVHSAAGSIATEAGLNSFPPESQSDQDSGMASSGNGHTGKTDDDGSSTNLATQTVYASHHGSNVAVEDLNSKQRSDVTHAISSNPVSETESVSPYVPEVKQPGSKRKKKKEIYAKADAQGPTADLFTAYKAPEEKKLDEVKRAEVPGSSGPGIDMKKNSLSNVEKPVPKELDDWEDAAELPTPKIAPNPSITSPNVSLVPGGVTNPGDFGVKKYTRDYLLSQRELHRELPAYFEIRADIADTLLSPQAGSVSFTDAVSPGRALDRQSSGGPRLDRRNSNVGSEDDRWTRSISSPGRGPSDARMEMGMPGPAGGFRPGQGTNAGLMRMPPGVRPGMGPPGIMAMGGLLPGGPLLAPHMMVPPGPGRNVGGVDADRWQRAPVGQKGLIPSPRTPLPAIHKTENRYQVGKISDEEQLKQRLIKGILNKLTPQNFEKLFSKVKEVHIDSATTLTGVISQIFDKALTEPTFCEMYAEFCVKLAVELPEFVEKDEKITFKRVLLNKCQEEFERGEKEQEEAEKVEEDGEVKLTPEEREEKRTSARRRMLGNIRFIGELYKKNMLTERIMHECIKKLLGEYQNPDEEDVEALCKLMSTIGRIIDHAKAKEHIDAYFKRMETLSQNMKLSSRLRFMLKDCIDLRSNGWTERRKVEGPKKIDEVHRAAVQERQQAASSRDRPQQRGGLAPGGGRRPGSDFAMRGPQSPMFSPGSQMGGGQPPPGAVRGGFGQDVRMEDRLLMDSRPLPIPLSQRPSDEGLTLGPQGGLGRGMAGRQPLVPGRSALADVPPMMLGDVRRPGMGPMPGFGSMIPERGLYGGRDDNLMRGQGAERSLGGPDRPLLERPMGPERLGPPLSGRDLRSQDRSSVERSGMSVGSSVPLRPLTPPGPVAVRSSPTVPLPLSEAELKKKSISALTEYFSVRDNKEAVLCVEDLKNPKFHPTMVSIWVSEALDKKDLERELLVKLLLHLCKEKEPPLLTHEHISKGFELVLSMLEDTTVDVPRAPEYVAVMLAKLIFAGVFSLMHVGKLLKEGGMDPGYLVETGDALTMIGVLLDTIRKDRGEAAMIDLYRASKLNLEDFLSPEDKRNGGKFEAFLEKKSLQSLYPMIPVEKYFREAIERDEPVTEILKWLEKNVPQSTVSDSTFLRMIMTEVLRHAVPLDSNGKALAPRNEKIKRYTPLLKKLLPGNRRAIEASQRQYIVAAQLFVNDLGHPQGLLTALFSTLYSEDVISEQAFLKWQDDVKDSTPGRDKAIKETFIWFRWLMEAPEEGGDDDE